MNNPRKVIVVTGATSGLGAELARQYAADNFNVALVGRREKELSEVAKECAQLGAEVLTIKADVCVDDDVKNITTETEQKLGRIDIFVANAGFGVSGLVTKLQISDYERQFDTNVYGVIRCAQAAFEPLKKTQGSFVIIGSVMSYMCVPGMSAYSMSKHSVKALSEALYLEWKPKGVAVTLICPGYVQSQIHRVANDGKIDDSQEDRRPGKLVVPTDVACRSIKKGIDGRKAIKIVTGHGKIFVWIKRHFEGLALWLMGRVMGSRGKRSI